jgi:hypothetical protein
MIYIPSFIKIGTGIKKLLEGIHIYTDSVEIAEAYFIFLKIRKGG